jgi:translation elongation factor P/translation initiation factor 5A
MKKPAELVKVGDKIKLAGEVLHVLTVEISDIGKQGQKKCRIEASRPNGEKTVIVRPSDYPVELA